MLTKRITRRGILVIGALLALGENEVRRLMLLIDTNNNGKITKNEWMAFNGGGIRLAR